MKCLGSATANEPQKVVNTKGHWQGKTEVLGAKIVPSATLPTTNPKWTPLS